MQIFVFRILVQTALIVGQFLTIEKITPKHYCINYTVMFSHLAVLHFYFSTLDMEAFSNKICLYLYKFQPKKYKLPSVAVLLHFYKNAMHHKITFLS